MARPTLFFMHCAREGKRFWQQKRDRSVFSRHAGVRRWPLTGVRRGDGNSGRMGGTGEKSQIKERIKGSESRRG